MKLCPDCISNFKRSRQGKLAKKLHGKWGKEVWDKALYHDEKTRKCQKHHAQALADSSARRAGINKATPIWANRKEIKEIYKKCFNMSKKTGVKHEVDHIIPLKGELVSGLHVHWNLQIIKASENRFKSNKFKV